MPCFICFRACLQQWHLLCGEHPNSWVRVCHLKWCVIKQDDQKGCQMNSNDINLERICFYFGPTAVIFSRLRLKGHLGPSKLRRCWSGQPWSARWRSPQKSRISSNWSRFQGSNTNHRTITLNHLPLLAKSRFTGLFLHADISTEYDSVIWRGSSVPNTCTRCEEGKQLITRYTKHITSIFSYDESAPAFVTPVKSTELQSPPKRLSPQHSPRPDARLTIANE